MPLLLGGVGVLAVTVAIFWLCLPRAGKMHRLVGTEWEPYVAVAFCAGFALSFTMIVSASINIAGGQ
jgi:hypothetical protein